MSQISEQSRVGQADVQSVRSVQSVQSAQSSSVQGGAASFQSQQQQQPPPPPQQQLQQHQQQQHQHHQHQHQQHQHQHQQHQHQQQPPPQQQQQQQQKPQQQQQPPPPPQQQQQKQQSSSFQATQQSTQRSASPISSHSEVSAADRQAGGRAEGLISTGVTQQHSTETSSAHGGATDGLQGASEGSVGSGVSGERRQGRYRKEVIRLPDQPSGQVRQVRHRLPTPEPDTLERM
jgi:outer membrane biosynthesis protein TonB